jgi:hypothetical protein
VTEQLQRATVLLSSPGEERKGELLARDLVRLYREDADPEFAAAASTAASRLKAAGR